MKSEDSLDPRDNELWELFHENSKQAAWYRIKTDAEDEFIRLSKMHLSLPHAYLNTLSVKERILPLEMSLGKALQNRRTSRSFGEKLRVEELCTTVDAAFGKTLSGALPRPLRATPSGGKAFPLEAYIFVLDVAGLTPGLYHFNAEKEVLGLVKEDALGAALGKAFVQSDLIRSASAVILLSAVFERTTAKYGDRGYRLVLLEAGHAAQNIDLAATALGLGHANIAAFYDHKLEDLIEADGVNHSVLYTIALGKDRT